MKDGRSMSESRFKSLLEHIAAAPLYQEKLAGIDLAGIGLDRIGELPLTTKSELREGGAYGHLAVGMEDIAHYHESTGTTGEPAVSWFTRSDLITGGRQVLDCGLQLAAEDLVLVRFPYSLALPAFLMEEAARMTGAGIVPASSRTPMASYVKVLQLMSRLGVTVVAGLPRELELLAETARLTGALDNGGFPMLRALVAAGELLGDARRAHLQQLWGVPVYNLYGSTETGNIAAMCEYGVMHVAENDFIVEALREDGRSAAEPEERGFAAVTTLVHRASPLLRYFNDDIITLTRSSCPCGRSGAELKHYGRGKDRISIGGHSLDALDIQDAVYSLEPVPGAWVMEELADRLRLTLDDDRSERWQGGCERIAAELAASLNVPVEARFAPLLDRDALLRSEASTKPVYIRRREPRSGSASGSTAGTGSESGAGRQGKEGVLGMNQEQDRRPPLPGEPRRLLVSRGTKPDDTVVTVKDAAFGGGHHVLVAGPCSVESREQLMTVAEALQQSGVKVLRGGSFKPRTSPYDFQGLGVEGMKLLKEAAGRYSLVTVSEVMHPAHIEFASQYIDILQIGTRSMQNFELLKEAGRSKQPVLLKRGMSATLEEFLLAAEYVLHGGNPNVVLIERGIRTFEKWTRNTLDISAVPVLKKETHLPVLVDVSHAAGRKDILAALAKASLAAGADGIMVEVHPNPPAALSDAKQQIDLGEFQSFLSELNGSGLFR